MSEPIEPRDRRALRSPRRRRRYLIGVRLREPLLAEDYLTTETELHVGDLVVVETGGGTAVGEVRRPKRPLPAFKRDRRLPPGRPPRHRRGGGASGASAGRAR